MVDESEAIDAATQQERLTSAFSRAHQRVAEAASSFEETGNSVFIWNAIAALTDPAIAGVLFPLPETVRKYLHTAALGVRDAAVRQPKDFQSNVMNALALTTKRRGHSIPRDYAYTQSLTAFLGVYAVFESKYGSGKACEMIGAATNTSAVSARVNVTKALNLLNRIRRGARLEPVSVSYIPDCVKDIHGNILPDGFLITALVKGAPHNYWRRNGV